MLINEQDLTLDIKDNNDVIGGQYEKSMVFEPGLLSGPE
jgi:hypothetical protein